METSYITLYRQIEDLGETFRYECNFQDGDGRSCVSSGDIGKTREQVAVKLRGVLINARRGAPIRLKTDYSGKDGMAVERGFLEFIKGELSSLQGLDLIIE